MTYPQRLLFPFYLCALTFIACSSLHAVRPNKTAQQWDAFPELNLTLTQKVQYSESKQKNTANGKIKNGSTETALGHDEKLDDGFFNIYGFFGYDKYAASTSIPMGDFYRYGLDLFYSESQWDEWGVWFMGSAELAGHHNATSKQLTKKGGIYKFGIGPSYEVIKDFTVYAGAYFTTKLEDQNEMFPVAGIFWKITPKLSVRTANGIYFTFDCFENKKLLLEASSEFRYKQYRLKDSAISNTTGKPGQAMTDKGIFTDFGLTYQCVENLWVRGFLGFVNERRIRAKSDGKVFSQAKGKTGYELGAQAGYSF